jgi:DNA-binding NarL/FixJ family response regulator
MNLKKSTPQQNGKVQTIGSRKSIRVLLVEENPLIAGFLRQTARNYASTQVISGQDALATQSFSSNGNPCLFILDEGSLPGGLGRYLRHINSHIPGSGKIVLGPELPVDRIFSLLLEGVSGFLCYQKACEELGDAIEAVMRGGLWLAPHRLEEVCLYVQKMWGPKTEAALKFTQRQKQVIDMVQQKLSNKEIASALHISENTVKFHLAKVFLKSGARGRSSLREFLKASGE